MSELAKHEFFKWVQSIDSQKLTPYEITYIDILVENFDNICAVGTSKGNRAKLIARLIEDKCFKTETQLVDIASTNEVSKRINRLVKLSSEHFRGFCAPVTFELDKQYTFFHGPNGSGKSSFCEALEFSLLGTIEEADTRNIPVQKYILHTGDKQANPPVLTCRFEDGIAGPSVINYEAYRFAFLEKNRIDKFSHISATTEKNQSERIAALFGLTEFSAYVGNFTESFDERYIQLTRKLLTEYQTKIEANKNNEINTNKREEEKEKLAGQIQTEINKLSNSSVHTLQEAIDYLYVPEEGLIHKLTKEADTNNSPIIKTDDLWEIQNLCISLRKKIEQISKLNDELIADIHGVNLLDLYKSVQTIKGDYTEAVCPACQTPLADVVENPFQYADVQVQKLSHIENVKVEVEAESSTAISTIVQLKSKVVENKPLVNLFSLDLDILVSSHTDKNDFITLTETILQIENCIVKAILQLSDKQGCEAKIEKSNQEAQEKNQKANEEIVKYTKVYENLVQLKAQSRTNEESTMQLQEEMSKFHKEYDAIQSKIEEERQTVEFNQQMVIAYNNVRQQLISYQNELPAKLSDNLASKTAEYYNIVNQGDAEFEEVEYFKLPISSSDKILVKLKDCEETDALQVLSEGHIRVLGLSILLAKALQEEQSFLIFDDIVNAIDDDHRDGVAELLINGKDFKNIQLILTCHGEQFVTNLEDKMSSLEEYSRYMFLPADSLVERGIVIKYQDAKIPLNVAKEKYKANELRDSAAKCRQATECITGKLWNQLSNKTQCTIQVAMRNPRALPDLSSIVDGLIKATKPSKLNGAQEINDCLAQLRGRYNWLLMSKGTHFESGQPEFSRTEIGKLLELLERFDKEVREMKVNVSI